MKNHLSDVVANSRHAFSTDKHRDCFDFFHTECLLVADPEEVGEFCLLLQSMATEIAEDEDHDHIKMYHDEMTLFKPEEFETIIRSAYKMYSYDFLPFISVGYQEMFNLPDDYTIDDLVRLLNFCLASDSWLLNEQEYLGFIIRYN